MFKRLANWKSGVRPVSRTPRLISFVVIAFDMQREVTRTLHSLARTHQQGCESIAYEVVVVDNGSPTPLDLSGLGDLGVPVRLFRRENAKVSPADAINFGVSRCHGDYVAVMIDGARMLSPGVVRGSFDAIALAREPVVAVLGLHLGPAHQRITVQQGYSKTVEDRLLADIDWPSDGYRLFEVSAWGGSCAAGWFDHAAESNCIVVSRGFFDSLGGFDERFEMAGGGLVNLDFYKRAVERADATLIYLLGEGCFHQLHGGVTTGARQGGQTFDQLNDEYRRLRGEGFAVPEVPAVLYGRLRPQHGPALASAIAELMARHGLSTVVERCAPLLAGESPTRP